MITIFAEKPDVARKIAAALGPIVLNDGTKVLYKDIAKYEKPVKAIQAKYGYIPIKFKGKDCAVTHGYGHLCSLWEPKDYDEDYRNWNNIVLPFIPPQYRLKINEESKKQFRVVSDLFNRSEYIINATDWDREGEVIFSYVYEMSRAKVPYKRAYYNSQNEEAFVESFNDLREAKEVKNLEQAGRCRGIADWLIGMNLTVAATLQSYTKGVLSIGRVQTPTLAMVVEREKAIKNFVSKEYFTVSGEFTTPRGEQYKGECSDKFDTEKEVKDFVKELSSNATVTQISRKTEKQNAPSLYSLSLLQMQANSKLGLTAEETLNIVQELYEAGVVTYPRTSSAFLPEDYMPQADRALFALEKLPQYEPYLKGKPHKYDKRFFNDKKVESHFAIVPTHVVSTKFSGDKAAVYDMICKSLIMTIYPPAEIEKIKVTTVADNGTEFVSNGSVVKQKGWMEIAGTPKDNILPLINEDETVEGEYKTNKRNTEPPKRYTDKTLIAAMMSADKNADDKDIMSLAELNIAGIGQESTRASIIENLVSRGYIERNKKVFAATDKGINLIDNLPVEELKSAELTAMWETRLNNVSKGTESSEKFIKDIEKQTGDWCNIVKSMKPVVAHNKETEKSGFSCPLCGHSIIKTKWGYGCSDYKAGCKFTVSNTIAGKNITETQIKKLFSRGSTDLIKGFTSKTGKKFDAKLQLKDGKIGFVFE